MATDIEIKCPDCGADSPPIKEWKFHSGGHQFRQQCTCGWKSSAITKTLAIQTNKSEKFEQFDVNLNNIQRSKTPPLSDKNTTYATQATFGNL